MTDPQAHEPIPLMPATAKAARGGDDRRPLMPLPLPVRLVTVDDARLTAVRGSEPQLDAFYVDLLDFERDGTSSEVVYHAENHDLRFELFEIPPARDDLRVLRIEIESLGRAEHRLMDAGIEYARQKGLNPGQQSILLQDPAGNWIELVEAPQLR